MNILITGGAGYIGAHTNKLLNQLGHTTIVFDNLSEGHKDAVKWGTLIIGDLKNSQDIEACLSKHKIEAVMHFAGATNVSESMSNPKKYDENNVIGSENLLKAMKNHNIPHIIFSSTCATYGTPQTLPLTEDHPQNPINHYGKTKLQTEHALKKHETEWGLKHINLRYFNAAGADPDTEIGEAHHPETHLIPLVIEATQGKRPHISIFGSDYNTEDGTCVRDYIHVTDLAMAHIKALDYLMLGKRSASFNLGNGQGFSVKEIIKTVEKISSKACPIIESPRREGDPPVLIGSSEKAKTKLNWTPKYASIETIIQTAWNWHNK